MLLAGRTSQLLDELDAVVGEDGVDTVGHSVEEKLQEALAPQHRPRSRAIITTVINPLFLKSLSKTPAPL
jgi:hypothetical protein